MRRLLYLLIPFALLVAACGGSESTTNAGANEPGGHDGHDENSDVADDARTITVNAGSFEFDPATLEIEAGEAIEIELTAEDAEHDFVIDELDAHVRADAGDTATGGFTAEEPGTYTYYCSVAGHRQAGMEGELVVQ